MAKSDTPMRPAWPLNHNFYSELIRINSWLFVGLLALMTFLLSVGLQRPKVNFSSFLYAAIITLGLNFILYVLGQLAHERYASRSLLVEDPKLKGDDVKKANAKRDQAFMMLRVTRVVQQVVFVVGIVAIVGLAIVAAQLFFAISTPSAG
jgi:hypothetical protein